MSLKLISPLGGNAWFRDMPADADFFSTPPVDVEVGAIVAVASDGSVGLATLDAPAAAWQIQAAGGPNGVGSNCKFLFRGTKNLDAVANQQFTILEGAGSIVDTDQYNTGGTYAPGDPLTVGAAATNPGKLDQVTIPATNPVVAIVESLDSVTGLLRVKIL